MRSAKQEKHLQPNTRHVLSALAIGVTLAIPAWTAVAGTVSPQASTRATQNTDTARATPPLSLAEAVTPRSAQAVPRRMPTRTTPRAAHPGITDVQLPPTGQNVPKLSQLGGTTATVPMKHGGYVVNGNEIGQHVLATQHGNLKMPARISMSCPQGTAVSWLSYQVPGHNQVAVIQGPTNAKSYSKKIHIQPFTAEEFEQACHKALGGDWLYNMGHNNTQKVVKTTLLKKIEVRGACTGWANKVTRAYPVTVTASCVDKDWSPPVP